VQEVVAGVDRDEPEEVAVAAGMNPQIAINRVEEADAQRVLADA